MHSTIRYTNPQIIIRLELVGKSCSTSTTWVLLNIWNRDEITRSKSKVTDRLIQSRDRDIRNIVTNFIVVCKTLRKRHLSREQNSVWSIIALADGAKYFKLWYQSIFLSYLHITKPKSEDWYGSKLLWKERTLHLVLWRTYVHSFTLNNRNLRVMKFMGKTTTITTNLGRNFVRPLRFLQISCCQYPMSHWWDCVKGLISTYFHPGLKD